MLTEIYISWINIKSHSHNFDLGASETFSTSRNQPTFHSTCQLPQSVWAGNLFPRLSYLLLSYCQGCLGNENHCEVTYGCDSSSILEELLFLLDAKKHTRKNTFMQAKKRTLC